MVRDADDSGGVTLSSIALLQERFRQLQRMKELRQERELMRTLFESPPPPPPALLLRQFSSAPSPPPPAQLALSLWPDSETKHAESRAVKAEAPTPAHFNPDTSDNDIDTSLRL